MFYKYLCVQQRKDLPKINLQTLTQKQKKRYCLCRMKYDRERTMIECCSCNQKYHTNCCDLEYATDEDVTTWICPVCACFCQ